MKFPSGSLSLYIHIPFCQHACAYCDFFFVVSPKQQESFFTALKNEITLYHQLFFSKETPEINSLYFGGGTPSWVKPIYINKLIQKVDNLFKLGVTVPFSKTTPEITLEVNPDDLTPKSLAKYCQGGVNRFSLGIQSFDQPTLTYLGRKHNQTQVENALQIISESYRKKEIGSWSMDLIYGIPTLNKDKWKEQLKKSLDFCPPHLSLYALTIEPHTSLKYQITKKIKPPPDEEMCREQFFLATEILKEKGYEHYEISNFALPGHHSQHNLGYWRLQNYLGWGPGAHSFIEGNRFSNYPRLQTYINTFTDKNVLCVSNKQSGHEFLKTVRKEEILSKKQNFNEYIMVSLRTKWGLDIKVLQEKFADVYKQNNFLTQAKAFQKKGWLKIEKNKVWLTNKGWLLADGIIRDFFLS